MNKLHDALKNEELMLEVGRKATEEQKAMTQSTVEDKGWEEKIKDIVFTRHQSGTEAGNAAYEAIVIVKSELQLAEQKAREDERERIGRTCMNIDGLKYEDGMLWVGIKSDSIDSVENFNIIPHKSLSTK